MEHKTKHKDHQRREDDVANLWRSWTSEIPTKLEKNEHLLSKTPWRRDSPSSVKCLARDQGGKMAPSIAH